VEHDEMEAAQPKDYQDIIRKSEDSEDKEDLLEAKWGVLCDVLVPVTTIFSCWELSAIHRNSDLLNIWCIMVTKLVKCSHLVVRLNCCKIARAYFQRLDLKNTEPVGSFLDKTPLTTIFLPLLYAYSASTMASSFEILKLSASIVLVVYQALGRTYRLSTSPDESVTMALSKVLKSMSKYLLYNRVPEMRAFALDSLRDIIGATPVPVLEKNLLYCLYALCQYSQKKLNENKNFTDSNRQKAQAIVSSIQKRLPTEIFVTMHIMAVNKLKAFRAERKRKRSLLKADPVLHAQIKLKRARRKKEARALKPKSRFYGR
jgi:hypothetical protein